MALACVSVFLFLGSVSKNVGLGSSPYDRGDGVDVVDKPGPVYLGWVFIWPIVANYIYFRSVASAAVTSANNPEFEQHLLDKGGVSKGAVWGGVLIALLSSMLVSNYVTSKFMEEYADQIKDVLPGSGSQMRGDGSILQDIPSNSSELASTSHILSGLATTLKILLVTRDSQQNQQTILKFIDKLTAGEVSDGWDRGIRIEQHVDKYVLLSAGPDQIFKTDDDILQPVKIP